MTLISPKGTYQAMWIPIYVCVYESMDIRRY